MVPVERPAGAGDALVLIDATSGAGGLPVDVGAGRRLLLRAAEGLRRRRRPLARAAQPGGDRADRASSTAPPGRWQPAVPLARRRRSRTRARTRPTTRPRSRRCSCSPTRSTGCSAAAASTGASRARRASSSHLYGWAEASEFATPFVADPAKRSLVVGTIDFDDAVDAAARRRRRCARTASSTPSPTASSAATSCGSACSRRSSPPTSRRSPPASTGWSRTRRREA